MLHSKAQEADENSRQMVEEVVQQVVAANISEYGLVKKPEEPKLDVEECKKALQEALKRVEAANHGKLAQRRWRYENGHKRRSIGVSPKFNRAAHHCKDSHSMDII